MNCEYKRTCKYYEPESACCFFLYKLCRYRKHIIKMEEIKGLELKAQELEKERLRIIKMTGQDKKTGWR
jgi:hypothetical protein